MTTSITGIEPHGVERIPDETGPPKVSLLTAITFFPISVWSSGDALTGGAHRLAGVPESKASYGAAYAVFAVLVLIVCVYGFRFMLLVNKVAVIAASARFVLGAIAFGQARPDRPKTRKSNDWGAPSPRIHAILTHRKSQPHTPSGPGTPPGGGFVFHREDGRPLHPEYVLNHFHYLARQAGVPRTSVHDLRHLGVLSGEVGDAASPTASPARASRPRSDWAATGGPSNGPCPGSPGAAAFTAATSAKPSTSSPSRASVAPSSA